MAKPFVVIEQAVPDPESIHPGTFEEYARRAWLYYGKHNYENSIKDFYKALDSDPENVDIMFGLGLALKADGKKKRLPMHLKKHYCSLKKWQITFELEC